MGFFTTIGKGNCKFSLRAWVVFATGLILWSCSGSKDWRSDEPEVYDHLPPVEEVDIPRDYENDTLRPDGQFDFQTLLTTKFTLKLILFDLDDLDAADSPAPANKRGLDDLVGEPGADATVILTRLEGGQLIFAGKTNNSGELSTSLQLPAHSKDAVLTVVKSGYYERNILVKDLVQYSSVERGVVMATDAEAGTTAILTDSDGDSIPDIYDAFPQDSSRAFTFSIPADDSLSVAFEDNFPELGDGDYNDFLARYQITKITDAQNSVVELQGDVRAVAKLAGYDHRFGMIINFPGSSGTLTINRLNELGATTSSSTETVSDAANAIFFEETSQAFTDGIGHGSFFSLKFDNPVASGLDEVPFDPYIYIHNTGYDVHLLGKPSLPDSNNPAGSEGFRDDNGFPRGLLIPGKWPYPKELTFIEDAYPAFADWRTSLGASDSDWYLFPEEGHTVTPAGDFGIKPEVTLPAGADSSFLQIGVDGITVPAMFNGTFVAVGKVYNITMTNGHSVFAPGYAELRYTYDGAALLAAGLTEEFQVYYLDSNDAQWKPADGGVIVDTVNSTVTARTSHFTPFVLTAAPSAGGVVADPPSCINDDFPTGPGGSGGAVFSLIDSNFRYYQDRALYRIIDPASSPENSQVFNDLGFAGAMGISTCNGGQAPCSGQPNHKNYSGNDYINFTAHTDLDVYVMYDTRGAGNRDNISQDATWLSAKGFTVDINSDGGTAPDYFVETSDPVTFYTVYKKTYNSGEVVSLDGNIQGTSNPPIGTNYWVVVKPAGNTTSNSASQLCVANPDSDPPGNVSNLSAAPGANRIALTWQNPDDVDFAGVVIRRSTLGPPMAITEGQEPLPGTVLSPQAFRDDSVAVATTYFYTVFSLDSNNNHQIGATVMATTGNDSDGDGLADLYEASVLYPTGLYSNSALSDTDGDGTNDGDEVGNGTDPTNSDATPPSIDTFTILSPNPGNTSTIDFSFAASDNIAVTGYLVTQTDTAPLSNHSNWQAGAPTQFTFPPQPGVYSLYAWVKDGAGNVSPAVAPIVYNLPLGIVETIPSDGDVDVLPADGQFTIQFAQAMNPGASNPGLTVEIWDGSSYVSTPVNIAVAWTTTDLPDDTVTLSVDWLQFPENTPLRVTTTGVYQDTNSNILFPLTVEFETTAHPYKFAVADTGQTVCDDGTNIVACPAGISGQDGDYTGTTSTLTRTITGSDVTVTDSVTGLVWKGCAEGQTGTTCVGNQITMDWYSALGQCAALNLSAYGGHTDWRLPRTRELNTIIDRNRTFPAIDTTAFVGYPGYTPQAAEYMHTATTIPTLSLSSGANIRRYGIMVNLTKANLAGVLCVAGSGAAAPISYSDNGDGTVTDNATGLIWQRCTKGRNNDANCSDDTGVSDTADFFNAISYCEGLTLAGLSWRLPDLNELASGYEHKSFDSYLRPGFNTSYFPNTNPFSSPYRSSSNRFDDVNSKWVAFVLGISYGPRDGIEQVRCVSN